MIQLGQHAPPTHVIAHISDTHFLGGGKRRSTARSTPTATSPGARAARTVRRAPEAIVVHRRPGRPRRAGRLRAPQGASSSRPPSGWARSSSGSWATTTSARRSRRVLFGAETDATAGPRLRRRTACASSRSTRPCPATTTASSPTPSSTGCATNSRPRRRDGTLLALHHPPIPSPIEIMAIIELQDQPRLADVIRGTDVRGILAGHLHYSTSRHVRGHPRLGRRGHLLHDRHQRRRPGSLRRRRRRPVDQPRARLRGHSRALDRADRRRAAGRRLLRCRARRARGDDARGAPRGVLEQDVDLQRRRGRAQRADGCASARSRPVAARTTQPWRPCSVDARDASTSSPAIWRPTAASASTPCARIAAISTISPASPTARGADGSVELDLELLRDWLWRGSGSGSPNRRSAAAPPRRAGSPRGSSRPGAARRRRRRAAQGAEARPAPAARADPAADRRHPRRPRGARATPGDPVAVRDLAIVELLYASALRVSELAGLRVADVDRARLTVRVLGKGSKERVVPFGVPAARALDALPRRGTARAARGDSPTPGAVFLGRAGRARCRPGPSTSWWRACCASCPAPGPRARTPCATRPPPTCSTAGPTCAPCRSCSATPASSTTQIYTHVSAERLKQSLRHRPPARLRSAARASARAAAPPAAPPRGTAAGSRTARRRAPRGAGTPTRSARRAGCRSPRRGARGPRRDRGIHRLEARQHPARVLDRQHRADRRRSRRNAPRPSAGARTADPAGAADVDAAMPGAVRRRRRDEGPRDRVRRGDRPRPARGRAADGASAATRAAAERSTDTREQHDGSRLGQPVRATAARRRGPVHGTPGGRTAPVVHLSTAPAPAGDFACPPAAHLPSVNCVKQKWDVPGHQGSHQKVRQTTEKCSARPRRAEKGERPWPSSPSASCSTAAFTSDTRPAGGTRKSSASS